MRRKPPTLSEVSALFQKLGGIDIAVRLRCCCSTSEQVEVFNTAKEEAKIHHRRLALEHHPDRGGDAEQFKDINAAWTRLQKVDLKPKPMRKSALSISEVRGPAHTSVFVGVTQQANPFWNNTTEQTLSQADYLLMMRMATGGK